MSRRARSMVIVEHSPDPRTLESLRVYTVERAPEINGRSPWWAVNRLGSDFVRYIRGTRSRALRRLAWSVKGDGLRDVRVYDSRGALVIR